MSEEREPNPEVLRKLAIAKEKKDAGDQAFKDGELKIGKGCPVHATFSFFIPQSIHSIHFSP